MKTFAFLTTVLAATVAFGSSVHYSQVQLPGTATQIKMTGAQYAVIPTKTIERENPNCFPHNETGMQLCQEKEVIVLESEAGIRVHLSYEDSAFPTGEGANESYSSVVLKLSDFSAAEVAALQAEYPRLGKAGTKIMKQRLALSAVKVATPIQVVDMKKSDLCLPINDEIGFQMNPCKDKLVYKTVSTTVVQVSVRVK